jgi:hypothetical protein
MTKARWTLCCCLLLAGCRSLPTQLSSADPARNAAAPKGKPSNERDWILSQKVLPYAKVTRGGATIHNIRNFDYITESDMIPRYYDRRFKWDDLESVDFIVTPFPNSIYLAHTMLSFGFRDGWQLAASVEARLEQGEEYSPIDGAAAQYELMYVLADERDVIRLRTEVRGNDVYIYRAKATKEQLRGLLEDFLRRANDLRDNPEFYDTLTNNCTSNIVQHVNQLRSDEIGFDVRTLLPGLSPRLAYDLGLLETRGSFEETRQQANVTQLARQWRDAPDFSQRIRRL